MGYPRFRSPLTTNKHCFLPGSKLRHRRKIARRFTTLIDSRATTVSVLPRIRVGFFQVESTETKTRSKEAWPTNNCNTANHVIGGRYTRSVSRPGTDSTKRWPGSCVCHWISVGVYLGLQLHACRLGGKGTQRYVYCTNVRSFIRFLVCMHRSIPSFGFYERELNWSQVSHNNCV